MKPKFNKKALPKSIIVFGIVFSVEISSELGEHTMGETDGYNRTIKINPNQSEEQLHSTLFHEALHAILHVSGLTALLTTGLEEGIVMALEAALSDKINLSTLENKE